MNIQSLDSFIDPRIDEDRDERKKRREERRAERLEKKFSDKKSGSDSEYDTEASSTGKFKIKPFIKAVEDLKNQIIAQITDCDARAKLNPELTAPKKYKDIFMGYLTRAAALLGEVKYRSEKEGRKLEDTDPKDQIIIKGFRETYSKLASDIEKSTEGYGVDTNKEVIDYQKGLEFKEITDPINAARALFEEAKNMAATALKAYLVSITPAQGSGAGATGAAGAAGAAAPMSSIKIDAPIKQWKSGPGNETVKKVQQLIYDKFKNNKTVSESAPFKAFAKGNFADGKNGRKTSDMVVLIKKGFKMAETSSDITQEFINAISAIKEGHSFMLESVLSYDEFLRKPVFEQEWSDDEFKKALSDYSSPSSGEPKPRSKKPSGEKKETETKEETAPAAPTEPAAPSEEEITKSVGEIDKLLVDASNAIVNLFKDASFWKEFKGSFDDDEEAAADEFASWCKVTLDKKFLNSATKKIAALPDTSEDKEVCQKNLETLNKAKSGIKTKLLGNQQSDIYSWKIYTTDGKANSYQIDADF